jgi:hypothetical protein
MVFSGYKGGSVRQVISIVEYIVKIDQLFRRETLRTANKPEV